ncbi:MAG TPA: acireductone synthase [Planctomycetota bacterium]|nr:acireductone synthase [Planctomycetota bacterium]
MLDIEGTTTSISFVFDVLFPYAAKAIPDFLRTSGARPELAETIALIRKDALATEAALDPVAGALAIVQRQMAGDVKATGLKQLQGLVWQYGYENGQIKGQVFSDVPERFAAWRTANRPVAIYSSGSRLAQQLLFRHSIAGDLTGGLAGYYDTTSGPKRESASYTTIAQAWGIAPGDIVFCTDQPAEADAALTAGMRTAVIMRPGNAPLPANLAHPVHADLLKV